MTRGTRALRAVLAALAACAVAACSPSSGDDPPGQRVEFVAGGGDASSGKAVESRIDGRLVGLTSSADGTVFVATGTSDGKTALFTVHDGTLTRAVVGQVPASAVSQLAPGPGGSVYLAATGAPGGVWQVKSDGTASPVVTAATGGGHPSADGTPAAGVRSGQVTGVAVAPGGQLYFAEKWFAPTEFTLVRTIRDGVLRTVLGRDLTGLRESQWSAMQAASGFPAGTPANQVALASPLPVRIAVDRSGRLTAATGFYRVAVADEKGSAAPLIGGGTGTLKAASAPFAKRGTAAEAKVWVVGPTGEGGLSAGERGETYLVNLLNTATNPREFAWSGDLSAAQKRLATGRTDRARASAKATEVLRVTPDGTVATAAYDADAVTVHGQWLYLAANVRQGSDDRVIVVRTAIPGGS